MNLLDEIYIEEADPILTRRTVKTPCTFRRTTVLITATLSLDPTRVITLILADGTRLQNYNYGSRIEYNVKIMGLFRKPFHPDEVVAIEYAGARIELK